MAELNLTDTEAAYIAGLIDGEGCVGVYVITRSRREISPQFTIFMSVAMTDEKTVKWLHKVIGFGSVHVYKNSKRDPEKYKPAWIYKVATRQAAQLLARIIPFMITKREQAELLVEIIEIRRFSTRIQQANPTRQLEIARRVKSLNSRGVSHASNFGL